MPRRRFWGPAPKLNLPKAPYPRLWSVADLARILGCTPQRIRALVKGKRIPCQRIGKVYFFRPEDLEDFELRQPRPKKKPVGYTKEMRQRNAEKKRPADTPETP